MSINKFINFTEKCPVCNNDLKLYMTWVNSMTFKGKKMEEQDYPSTYFFDQALRINERFDKQNCFSVNTSHNEIIGIRNEFIDSATTRQVFFYLICNESGIKESGNNFHINAAESCYYRATPFMEFSMDKSNKWNLVPALTERQEAVRTECLSFKNRIKNADQVYILNLDYYASKTSFWYYTISDDEKVQPGFRPKKFEKTFPLLNNRPKFSLEDREKLLDRFNSWIIVS